MSKYKVLVVGVGNMGSAHAKAYNDIEEFELVGLVARTGKRRTPLSKSLGGNKIPIIICKEVGTNPENCQVSMLVK